MKLNLKEKNSYLRTLNVLVPWEELKDEYNKEFKKIKSNYSMPGFRKGSVPDKILRKNLGKSIDAQFIDHALNIYYGKALQELTTKHGVILEDTPSDYFTEYMAAAKATLNKNAEKNKFFKKVYDSMKDFADVAVPFWSGAQMSNAMLGMAHAATLK